MKTIQAILLWVIVMLICVAFKLLFRPFDFAALVAGGALAIACQASLK